MRYYALLTFSLLLSGCIKEDNTDYEAFLINQSGHNVMILPYKYGSVHKEDTLRLAPNDTIQIANGSKRGMQNKGGFSSANFSVRSEDSVVIWFDGRYPVTHYCIAPDQQSPIYYPYNSKRNILQLESFDYEYQDKNKHSRYQKYTYIFTPEDYEYASR